MADASMTIGVFARVTGLSPKALRSYGELGLLRPDRVDPDTGYRTYSSGQVARGRVIRLLRELELPLLEIGPLLEAGSDELRDRLLAHQRRLALRAVELRHTLVRLQRLIEGKENLMDGTAVDPVDEATHRRLAVDLFNRSWQLLELPERTPEQDDELIHVVHASCFHWSEVGTPAHRSRGENQCARVYAALGHSGPALHHATRCLELVHLGGAGFEDWDLAAALEVLARAQLAAGDRAEAERSATLAREALAAVADHDDREVIESQLAELGLR